MWIEQHTDAPDQLEALQQSIDWIERRALGRNQSFCEVVNSSESREEEHPNAVFFGQRDAERIRKAECSGLEVRAA